MTDKNLPVKNGGVIDVWDNNKELRARIHKLFAPNLTSDEFSFYVGLGKSFNANPFKREIWAVKYDKNKPAQVFLSRDFHRKVAQGQPDYNGHSSHIVYEEDEFRENPATNIPDHTPAEEQKAIKGAYALAWRKGIDRPFFVFCSWKEYNKGQSTWKQLPETMMKKVAEAQVLRMAWQEAFSGTYAEDEQPLIVETQESKSPSALKKANEENAEANIDTEEIKDRFVGMDNDFSLTPKDVEND